MKGFIPSTREETHAAEQRRKLAEKRIEETDAGGGALKAWRGGVTQTCRSVAAVRRRRCRRFALLSVHGFALRASPAVKHGVSPLGTAGEHEGYSAQLHPCISSMLLRILSLSTSPIATLYGMYAFVDTLTHCTSSTSTSTQSNASGGGAPCVTAGDTRAKRGGTRGQADYSDPDAGGVALKAWRGNSDVQK